MSRTRVAIDAGPRHGHRTGIGLAVAELIDALDARDDVELLPYVVSYRARPAPPTRRLPVPAAFAHRWWSRADGPPVDRWLGPAHVVHGTNYVVPPSRRPRLVSVYDCWFLDHPEQAHPDVIRAGEVLRRSVRAGAWVHASSHATARRVGERLDTDRITVIHLGPAAVELDTPTAPAGIDPARPFVVALGTRERRKGLPTLVGAFGQLAAARDDLALVVAGAPGDDDAAIQRAVAALPDAVRARVHLLGPVTAGEKAWLLSRATLLAYPSLDEGFGFPLLEAQAADVPVVASAAGSIAEVGGTGVELVAPGDVDALADALARVAYDDARRAALRAAGRANVTRFSWATTAAEVAALYRRLVECSP